MATDVRWYTVYIFHSYSIEVMRFIISLCHDGSSASQCSVTEFNELNKAEDVILVFN